MFDVPACANTDPHVVVYAGSRWVCHRCEVWQNSRHRPVCWAGCGDPMTEAHKFKTPTSRSSIRPLGVSQ